MPKVISSKLLQDWTPAEAERLLQLKRIPVILKHSLHA
jgi:hypothetical protein